MLSLSLLAVVPLFVYASKETAAAGDLGSVGAIATQRMELIRQTAFINLPAGGSLTSDEAGYYDTSNAAYTVRWMVTDNASLATLKTIQVRVVATRAPVGLPKEITLTGIAAQ
jgi:hypothetical protein